MKAALPEADAGPRTGDELPKACRVTGVTTELRGVALTEPVGLLSAGC